VAWPRFPQPLWGQQSGSRHRICFSILSHLTEKETKLKRIGKWEDAISSVRGSGEKFLQVIPVPEIALPRRRGEFTIWKVREWRETGRECRPGWIRGSEKDEDPPLGVPGRQPPWRSCRNCRLSKQWSLLWGAARRCGCLWNRHHRWPESFGRVRPFWKSGREEGDNGEWERKVSGAVRIYGASERENGMRFRNVYFTSFPFLSNPFRFVTFARPFLF